MDNNGGKMRVTIEWMRENYNRLNKELFDGALGGCLFSDKVPGVKSLGTFHMNGKYIKYGSIDRKIFYDDDFNKVYINANNFYNYCYPVISMNNKYTASESSLLNTLVHEMCHYYTYMWGRVPKQAHGVEFRRVAEHVAIKSGGRFSIERLANAEEVGDYKLDDDILQKEIEKKEKRKSNARILVIYRLNGEVMIVRGTEKCCKECIDFLSNMKYKDSGKNIDKIFYSDNVELVKYLENEEKIFKTSTKFNGYYEISEDSLLYIMSNAGGFSLRCVWFTNDGGYVDESRNKMELVEKIVNKIMKKGEKILDIKPNMLLSVEAPM